VERYFGGSEVGGPVVKSEIFNNYGHVGRKKITFIFKEKKLFFFAGSRRKNGGNGGGEGTG
jgi:hypothetical protein